MKKRIIIVLITLLIVSGITTFILYNYTEIFGKKLLPLKISTLTIYYTPGLDLETAEKFNTEKEKTIEIQELKLSQDKIKKMQPELNKVKKIKEEKNITEKIYAKLVINKNVNLLIGNKANYLIDGNKTIKISLPTKLFNDIYEQIEKNNKKVLTKIEVKEAILKNTQATIKISNDKNIKLLNKHLNYYPINLETDYKTYNDGYKFELTINSNITLFLYDNKIAYMIDKRKEEEKKNYIIIPDDVYIIAQKLYEASKE